MTMNNEDTFPSPTGNPEFENYPPSFKNMVNARFQRGIRLGLENDLKAKEAIKDLRAPKQAKP